MPDPFDIYDEGYAPPVARGAQRPATAGEAFTAARTLQEVDNSDYLDRLYDEELGGVLEAVNDARRAEGLTAILPPSMGYLPGGKLPAGATNAYEGLGALGGRGDRKAVGAQILAEAARIRRTRPDFLPGVSDSLEQFLSPRLAKERERRASAGNIAAGAEGVLGTAASFAGGVTKAMEDPVNIATLPFGGGGRTVALRVLSEAALNAGIEVLQMPSVRENRAELGEELTAAEAAQNVIFAALGGAVFQGAGELAVAGGRKLVDRLTPIETKVARALEAADPATVNPFEVLTTVLAKEDPELLGQVIARSRGEGAGLTPDEAAAVSVLQRAAEIDAANPFAPIGDGRAQFEDGLTNAIDQVLHGVVRTEVDPKAIRIPGDEVPRGAAQPLAPVRGPVTGGGAFDREAVKARIRGPESDGDDGATNRLGSSASGRYQFIEGTFKGYYRKVYGASDAEAARAWNSKRRFDPDVQEALMDRLLDDNAAALQRGGFTPDAGNLYLAHFAGAGTAVKLLRAPPDAPVSRYFSREAILQNPTYLGGGKSVSETIAIVRGKVGGRAASVPAGGGAASAADAPDTGAVLRDEALQLQREAADIQGLGPVTFDRFDPDDIGVDASLMQFKGGGDDRGVTERLQGVQQWNPVLAGRVIVWEAENGRRLIADGHQRHGLASRIKAADPAQQPQLDALVLREADGWSAEKVRTWAALKNIAEGSGTAVDAAKVMRGIPREDWAKYLPPKSALVRDAEGLVQLGDDAFGMVVNELVDASHAAIVGRLARDPGEQKGLVDLLARLQPRTIGEANGVIRQGIAAGFARETQEDMFGELDVTTSLFVERARVLDRGLAELRKLRQAFGSAARNAEALESAGNRIDRAASEQEVADNAQAVELVERSAWSAGPVKAAIDDGARRLSEGARIGDVVRDFVAAVRQLELADLARIAESGDGAQRGGGADGAGRAGDADQADAQLFAGNGDPTDVQLTPEGDAVDPVDGAWPTMAELEEAGQTGFDLGGSGGGDAPTLAAFDEPHGTGAKIQADSLEHDVRMAVEAATETVTPGAALQAKIVADFDAARAEYDAIEGDLSGSSEGGRILNTDLARELSPEYVADRSRSAEVHEPASAFVKELYARKLTEDPPAGRDREVLFTAGGTGAGKSTGLKAIGGENAGIIYDTNMNTLASSIQKIEQALDAEWPVTIIYTFRDPVEALTAGALPRAERMGRTVPLSAHVDTHVGARQVAAQLAERYKDDPRVVLRAIDNSRGKHNAVEVPLEKLPEVNQVGLYERLENEVRAAFERGAIREPTFRGSLGERAQDLRPAPREGSGREGGPDSGQPQPADGNPLDRPADPQLDYIAAERVRYAALEEVRARLGIDATLPADAAVPAYLREAGELRLQPLTKQQIADRFADLDGMEAARLAEIATDPSIADRQRRELELGAAAPARAAVDQDGTMGLGLFDRADQPQFGLEAESRFTIDGEDLALGDLLAQADTAKAAIAATRACL